MCNLNCIANAFNFYIEKESAASGMLRTYILAIWNMDLSTKSTDIYTFKVTHIPLAEH